MKKILLISLAAVFAAVLFSSCGTSTKVVSSWKSPEASGAAGNKILVLAMMTDREAKDYIERTLAADLSAQGIATTTGTTEFGPRGFGNLTQDQVNSKLSGEGFSAIMIICLTDKDKELNYVPGTPYVSPYGTYYGYYGRYRYMWDTIYSPGYYTTSTTYVLDADLYTLPEDRLIYSAQTRSYDPANSQSLAKSFAEEIVRDLKGQNII
ncbi:MAG: hypothetical protein LIO77_03795 [Rikenellaceae bacterium]|nr:hypothetical protein [Rikenellaceae bacterium]